MSLVSLMETNLFHLKQSVSSEIKQVLRSQSSRRKSEDGSLKNTLADYANITCLVLALYKIFGK